MAEAMWKAAEQELMHITIMCEAEAKATEKRLHAIEQEAQGIAAKTLGLIKAELKAANATKEAVELEAAQLKSRAKFQTKYDAAVTGAEADVMVAKAQCDAAVAAAELEAAQEKAGFTAATRRAEAQCDVAVAAAKAGVKIAEARAVLRIRYGEVEAAKAGLGESKSGTA